MSKKMQFTDLESLLIQLNEWAQEIADGELDDYPIDVCDLPTFGSSEWSNPTGTYSWDDENVIVPGDEITIGHHSWTLIPRSEFA